MTQTGWAPGLRFRTRNGDGNRDWTLHANCRGHRNPDLWFPGKYENTSEEALAICNTAPCPVRAACRQYAKDLHISHGIWGGVRQGDRPEGHDEHPNRRTKPRPAEQVHTE